MIHEAVYQKMRSGVDMVNEPTPVRTITRSTLKRPAPKMEQEENPWALAGCMALSTVAFTMLAAAL